jgi:FlaA1/EpsC-like NDP-sugar epimerase
MIGDFILLLSPLSSFSNSIEINNQQQSVIMSSTNTDDWSQLLTNKVVFITGAAGHIAKCIAKTCYAQGARLVLGDLDLTLTNKVKDEIIGK